MQSQLLSHPYLTEAAISSIVISEWKAAVNIQQPQIELFQRKSVLPSSDVLWVIESGFARTLTWDSAGDLATLGIWGAGDIIGRSLSQIEPYQIECLTSLQVRELPHSSRYLHDAMLTHIQQMETLLSIMHAKQVASRLLKLLEWLAYRFGDRVDRGWILDLRLTHQILSEIIGTTRVTTTRILKELEQQGKLQRLRLHKILLLDAR